MKTKLLLSSLLFMCAINAYSTKFYSGSAGFLNATATWWSNAAGTALPHPANFTTANDTFVIVNNAAPTLNGVWTVSGANSIVQLGDGIQIINFTIPTTAADRLNGTINVLNNGTLTINNAVNPTIGTLSSGSTVVYSDAANQTVIATTYYNLSLGGSGTKSLANTASSAVTNLLTINAGVIFQLNTNAAYILNLNGTLSGTGTMKGGASSNLTIGGTGAFGTMIPSASPLTLDNFTLNRTSSGNVTLGGNLTISGAFTQTNGILNLNGNTLTLSGTVMFPAASANGSITGSATSSIVITATSITNNLYMTSGAQTLSGLSINSAGVTLTLGSDLTVSGAFTQTRGIININGNTLSLTGTATFAASAANGTISGSATSNLLISATTITRDLYMTAGAQTLNNFTLNSSGQTLILGAGNAITISGIFTQTNGILNLNGNTLTLSGTIVFPAASANGTITGSNVSNLTISATSITNDIFFTTGGGQTLKNFTLNSPGKTLTLGTSLTLAGAFTQTNGILNLNGNTLALNGTVFFPAASANGTITGSATSNISITATAITNDLFMTSGSQTLNNLTLNTAGVTLILGSDLTISGTYTQTKGIMNINGNTISLTGTAIFATTAANGTTTGSPTSNLLISATTITNSLFMTVGSQTLQNFTLNSAGKTLTLGTGLTVDGTYTQTNGIIKLNGQTLTLNGAVVFPITSANGTITGTAASNLIVNATSITNDLFFTTGALTLNSLTMNSPGQTLTMGTGLTLSGTFTHTSGIININGQTLTFNGPVVFPTSAANGSFTGSSTSSISIATPAGGAITNSMYMTQTNSSTNSLNNFTLNRTGGTVTLGNTLNLIGELLPTVGTFASVGNLTLVASSATVSGWIGPIGGSVTGNVTVQTYEAGGTTGWTLMGAPGVTGSTFSQWNSAFYITCPTCPDGDGTAQYGSAFTSVDSYLETAGGLFGALPRYVGISNVTDAITIGKGYWVYLGNGATTTSDILVSTTGPVNQGNFVYTITMTNAGGGTNATDHGYNLLSNPYPAPINWTSLRAGNASITNSLYVYNPDLNGYASYAGGVSSPAVGSGGIGNLIPAGQGFYVKASAANTHR